MGGVCTVNASLTSLPLANGNLSLPVSVGQSEGETQERVQLLENGKYWVGEPAG